MSHIWHAARLRVNEKKKEKFQIFSRLLSINPLARDLIFRPESVFRPCALNNLVSVPEDVPIRLVAS